MNVRPIDRLGLPRVKRSHTFLRWQRRQLARECYQAGLRREQICLWFAGYPKRRPAMSGLGRKRTFRYHSETGSQEIVVVTVEYVAQHLSSHS